MQRDNGFISALVVCLILPSMAGMWWRYSLDPALHAPPAPGSSVTLVESEPPVNAPAASTPKKPVKRSVAIAGIGFVPLSPDARPDELDNPERVEPRIVFTQDGSDDNGLETAP